MSHETAEVRSAKLRNVALWIWALLLFGGLIAGRTLPEGSAELISLIGRMGSSSGLVLLGWIACYFRGNANFGFAPWIAWGMTLGCIGDLFNANLLDFIPLSNPTIGAIITFGLGHLCYITAIVMQLASRSPSLVASSILLPIVGWQLVGLISWYWIVFGGSRNQSLVWPALGYTLLLSGTAGVASALSIKQKLVWPLAVGAALFLLSDLLLAYGMFHGSYPLRSEAVWLTYGPGQMLIVYSIWLVNPTNSGDLPSKK